MKITNRKYHEYTILKDFAGIQLVGSEVKSIRNGNAPQDSYYLLLNNEIYIGIIYS